MMKISGDIKGGFGMGDVFKEQLIKRKPSLFDQLTKTGLILAVVALFLPSMTNQFMFRFAPFITLGAGVGAWWVIGRLRKEYEYIFTNGELDIDIIYNKASRKRLFTGEVKNFEIMAPAHDPSHKQAFDNVVEVLDYSTGNPNENTYAFVTKYKGKRVKVILEPNEEMLDAIVKVLAPRKKFHAKN